MARRFDYHHQQQHQQAGRRTLAAFCFAFVLFLLVAAYLFSGFKPGPIPTSSVDEDQDRAGDGLGGPNTSDALGDEPMEHEIRDSSKLSLNLPPVKGAGEPADSDMEPPGRAADEEEGGESAAQEGLRGARGGDARAQAERERDAQDAAAQEGDSEGGDGQAEEGLLHSRSSDNEKAAAAAAAADADGDGIGGSEGAGGAKEGEEEETSEKGEEEKVGAEKEKEGEDDDSGVDGKGSDAEEKDEGSADGEAEGGRVAGGKKAKKKDEAGEGQEEEESGTKGSEAKDGEEEGEEEEGSVKKGVKGKGEDGEEGEEEESKPKKGKGKKEAEEEGGSEEEEEESGGGKKKKGKGEKDAEEEEEASPIAKKAKGAKTSEEEEEGSDGETDGKGGKGDESEEDEEKPKGKKAKKVKASEEEGEEEEKGSESEEEEESVSKKGGKKKAAAKESEEEEDGEKKSEEGEEEGEEGDVKSSKKVKGAKKARKEEGEDAEEEAGDGKGEKDEEGVEGKGEKEVESTADAEVEEDTVAAEAGKAGLKGGKGKKKSAKEVGEEEEEGEGGEKSEDGGKESAEEEEEEGGAAKRKVKKSGEEEEESDDAGEGDGGEEEGESAGKGGAKRKAKKGSEEGEEEGSEESGEESEEEEGKSSKKSGKTSKKGKTKSKKLRGESADGAEQDGEEEESSAAEKPVEKYEACDPELSEIVPCLSPAMNKRMKLKLNTKVMEHYERHCPPDDLMPHCLVPQPPGYKTSIPWPRSRDEVWRANVPHTLLATEKSDQHWMVVDGDIIRFPGGGTHFPGGADKYIEHIGKMMGDENGNFSVGGKIRTVLDIGCGVASFGAYLLDHSVLTMSVAPNDVHENQIQFALERGLPAFLGVMGTQRLPFPSLAFDLAHCSRCRIDWLQRDGLLLLELDRVIRPGGYWVWSAPPVYREDEENQKLWTDMLAFMGRMCWKVKAQSGQTAIFKKPKTNLCIKKRAADTEPPLCDAAQVSPNSAWYTPMDACVNTVPKGKKNKLIQPWPERLVSPSPRIDLLGLAKSDFEADTEAWEKIVADYDTLLGGQALLRPADSTLKGGKGKGSKAAYPIRNVIDINAHMGGFAAALAAQAQAVWVMNTVPPQGEASSAGLAMVYDRGLIGVYHDWCEPFSTYPRTYDLVHAWRAVSQVLKRKCSLEALLLELDRILRPKGVLLFRDSADVIARLEKRLKAVKWIVLKGPVSRTFIDGEEEQVLVVQKRFWRVKEKAGLKESAEAAASTDGDAEERRRL